MGVAIPQGFIKYITQIIDVYGFYDAFISKLIYGHQDDLYWSIYYRG
jgi:hypothetical protein